ncbi:hypothetical protein Tco_0954794 [Tanacetum coccineum]|uniref:Uncharacterized protein n=1 Tax=Tanacetum coccineum TaxID=301880 RepID=A0ABQ5E5F9_9ASTR
MKELRLPLRLARSATSKRQAMIIIDEIRVDPGTSMNFALRSSTEGKLDTDLYSSGLPSDVTIEVEDVAFHLHKVMRYSRSSCHNTNLDFINESLPSLTSQTVEELKARIKEHYGIIKVLVNEFIEELEDFAVDCEVLVSGIAQKTR